MCLKLCFVVFMCILGEVCVFISLRMYLSSGGISLSIGEMTVYQKTKLNAG